MIPSVMLTDVVQPVHTTGVNWDSVATIVGAIVILMSAIFGVFAWYVASQIKGAINVFRIDVVAKLDERLGVVETKLDTISTNNPAKTGRRLDERGGNYSTVYWGARNSGGHYGAYYGS